MLAKLPVKIISIAFVSLVIALAARFEAGRVPRQPQALPLLYNEPTQTNVTAQPFHVEREGHQYQIEPLADYELFGLVVSTHDAQSVWDISHASWGDHLNTKDLCVVWGKNLDINLAAIRFWSGDFTCYFLSYDRDALAAFNYEQISNNHLVPAGPLVAKAIAEAEVGDQVRIRGQLVNYSIDGRPARKTSLVRTDQEGGACETVFVTDFSILARANGFWIKLARLAWSFFALTVAGFLFLMFHAIWRAQRAAAAENSASVR